MTVNYGVDGISYIKLRNPDKKLVEYLYKHFSFSHSSLLSDYSKLYIKSARKVKFDIVFAICNKSQKIVGWGIAAENLARTRKSVNYRELFPSRGLLLMLFVKPSSRKRGLASRILKQLIRLNPDRNKVVIAHDKVSLKFFTKFSKQVTIIDWM